MKSVEISEKQQRLLALLSESPELEAAMYEMADIAGSKVMEFESGDDAEDATIEAMHNAGRATLQRWAQRRAKLAEEECGQEKGCRPHENKVVWTTSIGVVAVQEQGFLRTGGRRFGSLAFPPSLARVSWSAMACWDSRSA